MLVVFVRNISDKKLPWKDGLAVVVTWVVWSLSTFVTVKGSCSWLSTLKKFLQRLWQQLKVFVANLLSRWLDKSLRVSRPMISCQLVQLNWMWQPLLFLIQLKQHLLRLKMGLRPMTIHVCVTDTLTFVVQKCWKILNFVLRWLILSVTTWMSWSLLMWRRHSFRSQHQKGRVTIWCHLVSTKDISMLFLKVHRLPNSSWWMLDLTVTTKSSNVSVTRTCVETVSLSLPRSTWKRHSLVSKKSKISQKAWLRAWWKKPKASK